VAAAGEAWACLLDRVSTLSLRPRPVLVLTAGTLSPAPPSLPCVCLCARQPPASFSSLIVFFDNANFRSWAGDALRCEEAGVD
jgi:hypothetical protein